MAKRNINLRRGRKEPGSLAGAALKGIVGFSLAAAGSWILYSYLAIDHNMMMPEAIPAERKTFESRSSGKLSYYVNRNGQGRPIVFIHSINAAASSYEMRPLFLHYLNKRPVYALDLPGFGFSDRSNRVYSPGLYQTAILDFLETVLGGEPADVVALSLGSEFAAQAALNRPEFFNSLVLISPTGFSLKGSDQGSQKASRSGLRNFLHPAFSFPVWGRPFYDLIVSRTSIEYFLQQSFTGAVPNDLIEYDYAASHQPGAEHAPLYFISGKLFTPDIRQAVYERLQTPTLVLYDRDNFTSFEMLPDLLSKNASWQAVRLVPTMGMPHFERPEDTAEVLNKFWK